VVEEGECGNVVLKVLFGGGVAFEVAADVGVKVGKVTEGNEKLACPAGWGLGLFHVCAQVADEVLSLIALIKERELFFAGKLLKHCQQIFILSDFVTALSKKLHVMKVLHCRNQRPDVLFAKVNKILQRLKLANHNPAVTQNFCINQRLLGVNSCGNGILYA
jgi:hypothetical protein